MAYIKKGTLHKSRQSFQKMKFEQYEDPIFTKIEILYNQKMAKIAIFVFQNGQNLLLLKFEHFFEVTVYIWKPVWKYVKFAFSSMC